MGLVPAGSTEASPVQELCLGKKISIPGGRRRGDVPRKVEGMRPMFIITFG